jgi:hypothetical protein
MKELARTHEPPMRAGGDGGERVKSPPVATGPDARAVIDFANGLIEDLPAGERPAAFGAFMTAFRLGIALARTDAGWAETLDDELAVGVAEHPEEQRRQAAWAIAQIRTRAGAYRRRSVAAPPGPVATRN